MIFKSAKFLLDRPGGRGLLGYGLTVKANLHGNKARIFAQDDCWVHRFKEGAWADWRPRTTRNLPSWLERQRQYWASFYRPRSGDTIIEIGAGVGIETLIYSRAVGPAGRVIAIEAHPKTHRCLVKTCEVNGLTNVTPLNLAVVEKAQDVYMEDSEKHIGNAVTAGATGTLKVAGRSIDEICMEEGVGDIACIRMNIEGAERFAIRGMDRAIQRTAFAQIACHDFKADRTGSNFFRTKNEITQFLIENGFEIVPLDFEDVWAKDHVYSFNPKLVTNPMRRPRPTPAPAASAHGLDHAEPLRSTN